MELVDSIDANGVLSPILVRPVGESFEVVDGFNRYQASKDLGRDDIPVVIRELSDEDVLAVQVIANATVIPTDPIDYAYRLRLIMSRDKDMTQAKLAKMLNKSIAWVSRMLGLEKLIKDAAVALRRGEMTLTSAIELSTLPKFLQVEFLGAACNLPTTEFVVMATAQRKAFKEAVRVGSFKPIENEVAYLKPLHLVKKELINLKEAGPRLLEAETPIDGWRQCLKWVLNLN